MQKQRKKRQRQPRTDDQKVLKVQNNSGRDSIDHALHLAEIVAPPHRL